MQLIKAKNSLRVSALFVCMSVTSACKDSNESDQQQVALETNEQRVSYVIGYSIAEQIQGAGLKVDSDALNRAINDVANGNDVALSQEQMRSAGSIYQNLLREKKLAEVRAANIEAGEKFLTDNAAVKNVKTTASGLQYAILQSGEGKSPKENDRVKVHYEGALLDGTVFESSVESDAPVNFIVNEVIPGWTEILQLMTEGDKWRVWIPHFLAYPNGTQDIPSGSTIVFEIELLEVE